MIKIKIYLFKIYIKKKHISFIKANIFKFNILKWLNKIVNYICIRYLIIWKNKLFIIRISLAFL